MLCYLQEGSRSQWLVDLSRDGLFPVELAVTLEQPSHLERVQVLSHEFMVRAAFTQVAVPPCLVHLRWAPS